MSTPESEEGARLHTLAEYAFTSGLSLDYWLHDHQPTRRLDVAGIAAGLRHAMDDTGLPLGVLMAQLSREVESVLYPS